MHHHYLTIEQRKILDQLVRSSIGVGTRLDAALERLHQPDYGVCIECGKDIAFILLAADPLAVHCRACSRLPVFPGPRYVDLNRDCSGRQVLGPPV